MNATLSRLLLIALLLPICNTDSISQEIQKDLSNQLIILKYENVPKNVYVNEIFQVDLKAIIAIDEIVDINTTFFGYDNIKIFNQDSKWTKESSNIYINTYYVKILGSNNKLPTIYVDVLDRNTTYTQKINLTDINIVKLNENSEFSGVIAKNINIDHYKAVKFDSNTNLILLELSGEYANFSDFHLKSSIRDGIDSIEYYNLPTVKASYFAVLNNKEERVYFSYFNIDKNSLESISLPIKINEYYVSTHTNLNPQSSNFEIYKFSILFFFASLFLILFFIRSTIKYIILTISILIYIAITQKIFLNDIYIKKDSSITVIPTSNSTVFYITDKQIKAKKIIARDGYTKIILPNGNIGWIKDANIIKN